MSAEKYALVHVLKSPLTMHVSSHCNGASVEQTLHLQTEVSRRRVTILPSSRQYKTFLYKL